MTKRDLHGIIRRGRDDFSPAAYMVAVYRHTAKGNPYIYHVETFYGRDGRTVRGEARQYVKRLETDGFRGFRTCHIPAGFSSEGLPPLERKVPEDW